jgi:hypothetical protein
MDKLTTELSRLYGRPGEPRALVLGFRCTADWERAASLWQALQEELELPAPAISVSVADGYRLWLSLAAPLPTAEVQAFLDALRGKYLADLSPGKLELLVGESASLSPVPALDPASGKWSAFIDPSMGSMFVEEPGLEMAPSLDRQADMLAGLRSITANSLRQAMEKLQTAAEPDESSTGNTSSPGPQGHFTDPKNFLLAVMNDASLAMRDRIEAAKALLPVFDASRDDHGQR